MYPYDDKKHLFIISDEHYKFAQKFIKEGKSVLDVGCGTGALIPYLQNVDYLGIDATLWAVEKANDPRITFCDVFGYNGNFDYVCAFGVLDTALDLKVLADKLKSLGNVLLFSFREGTQKKKFNQYTTEEVIEAFGKIELIEGKTSDETYGIWRK
tara:strand:+ start:918 stop:1382 length:465 start_codon:yes stop_codon:yes gene_type:complete